MKKIFTITLALYMAIPTQFNARSATRNYTKKAPYAGMGKQSKRNGLIKTKSISGHGKRTKKGYTYVNSYARSK